MLILLLLTVACVYIYSLCDVLVFFYFFMAKFNHKLNNKCADIKHNHRFLLFAIQNLNLKRFLQTLIPLQLIILNLNKAYFSLNNSLFFYGSELIYFLTRSSV